MRGIFIGATLFHTPIMIMNIRNEKKFLRGSYILLREAADLGYGDHLEAVSGFKMGDVANMPPKVLASRKAVYFQALKSVSIASAEALDTDFLNKVEGFLHSYNSGCCKKL